jgi:glucose/arabinose dehydrogenase
MIRSILSASAVLGVLVASVLVQVPRAPAGDEPMPELPRPYATPSVVKHPKVIGWPRDRTPSAPEGFRVAAFVRDIESPRWIYVLPNGDVLVAQSRTLPRPRTEEGTGTKKEEKEKEKGKEESKTVTGTWRSARASTTARERRWPVWKGRSPSRPCCAGCRGSVWRPTEWNIERRCPTVG